MKRLLSIATLLNRKSMQFGIQEDRAIIKLLRYQISLVFCTVVNGSTVMVFKLINIYYRTDTGKYYELDTVLPTSPKDEWHAVSNE